jgi:hypothetical protein
MGALRTTIEVLASEFGDPDGAVAGPAMEIFDVFLELWEPDVVPMDGNDVRLGRDALEEGLDPCQTIGCRSGRGGAEDTVAFVGEVGDM